jgi:hypothetical protein
MNCLFPQVLDVSASRLHSFLIKVDCIGLVSICHTKRCLHFLGLLRFVREGHVFLRIDEL